MGEENRAFKDKLSQQAQKTSDLEDQFNFVLNLLQTQGMNSPSSNSEKEGFSSSSQAFFK
jgi:hypothetical protein